MLLNDTFLLRDAMLARYMLWPVSVRPSVRPFVTSWSSVKKSKHTITQTTPYDNPGTSDVKDQDEISMRPLLLLAPNTGELVLK